MDLPHLPGAGSIRIAGHPDRRPHDLHLDSSAIGLTRSVSGTGSASPGLAPPRGKLAAVRRL